ncbi:MAG: hypothetical protein JSS66_12645 [Armatimonadetes bacterium]|nr:hypothetical protein [Armatimonadota bacterium]
MRKYLLLLPLLLAGCTPDDGKPVGIRPSKKSGPTITVSELEKIVAPELGANHNDSFLAHLGADELAYGDDKMKDEFANAGEPNQPWQGGAGMARRRTLVEFLKKAESASAEAAATTNIALLKGGSAQNSGRRITGEALLARCLLEEGDSKGAADAMVQALKWTDSGLRDSQNVEGGARFHVVRERVLKAALQMAKNPALKAEDHVRILDQAKAMRSMRTVMMDNIAWGFRFEVLNGIYNITATRGQMRVAANIIKGDQDPKAAEEFVAEVLKDHKQPWDAHGVAKMSSDQVMAIGEAMKGPWPECKKVLVGAKAKAAEVWGVDIFHMPSSQMKDKALIAKVKEKIASVDNPIGYLSAYIYTSDYNAQAPRAYTLEAQDNAYVSAITQALAKKQGKPVSGVEGVVDPVSGQAFVYNPGAGTYASPYKPAADDPQDIKTFVSTPIKV